MVLRNKWMTAAIVFGSITIAADSAMAQQEYGRATAASGPGLASWRIS